MIVDWK
jgi:hypothetical protein